MSLAKFKARLRTQEGGTLDTNIFTSDGEQTTDNETPQPTKMVCANVFEKYEVKEEAMDGSGKVELKNEEMRPPEAEAIENIPAFPEFIKIKENIYLTEKSTPKEQKMRRMRCECVPSGDGERGCLEGCYNRELFIECGHKCLYGDLCANKRFQQIENGDVEPFFAGAKGWGLRARSDIPSDTFMMEYVGEVLNGRQFEKRTRRYGKDDTHKHHYFMALKADTFIDATDKGSISRFINHSCDPNCATHKWCVDGELRIGFFSIKDLAAGEELTFDYRFQRYGREAQVCYCGSANCRGFIGEQASKDEQVDDENVVKEEKQRRKREREMIKDKQVERELRDLVDKGALRNKNDVLKCSRIMVRSGDFETQMAILDLIKNSEGPLLRVFLDFQGCQLLWIWSSSHDLLQPKQRLMLQHKIVQVLQVLPIPHRNMLEDSHVLRTVIKWANPEKERVNAIDVDVEACVKWLLSQVCADEDESCSSSASPGQDSNDDECNDIKQIVVEGAKLLLERWEGLSKYFKIPKKTNRAGLNDRGRYCDERIRPRESRFNTATRRSTLPAPVLRASTTLGAYYNRPNSRKRFNADTRYDSPKYVATTNLVQRKAASSVDLCHFMKPPPPPAPAAPKQRVSRFDRKTPPHLLHEKIQPQPPAVLTKEEKRRAFELAVKASEKDNVQETMKLDFELAAAKVKEESEDTGGVGLYNPAEPLVDEGAYNAANPLNTSHDPSEASSQSPSTSHSDQSGIAPVPNQPDLGLTSKTGARPAVLVADSNTQSYWWQDQASGTLVYQVQPAQAAKVTHNDWSIRPWFQFEPDSGLIHEVRVDASEVLKESSPTVSTSLAHSTTTTSAKDLLPDDSYFGLPPGLPAAEVIRLLKKQIVELRARLANGEVKEERPMRPASAMSVSDDDDVPTKSEHTGPSFVPSFTPSFAAAHVKPEPTSPQQQISAMPGLDMAPADPAAVIPDNLPPNWKVAFDNEQNPYYYNTITKETQWDPPVAERSMSRLDSVVSTSPAVPSSVGPKTPQSPSPKRRKLPRSTSSAGRRSAEVPVRVAADTSSVEMTEKEATKIREQFKADVSSMVVKTLSHYRKDGRFKTEADFKHLARKISHGIMEKEMKQKSIEMLVVTDSVMHKAKTYIKSYMKKVGKVYSRPDRHQANTSIVSAHSESAYSPNECADNTVA